MKFSAHKNRFTFAILSERPCLYQIIIEFSGLLEIAANVITIFALLFLGRRLSVCGSMAIGQFVILNCL